MGCKTQITGIYVYSQLLYYRTSLIFFFNVQFHGTCDIVYLQYSISCTVPKPTTLYINQVVQLSDLFKLLYENLVQFHRNFYSSCAIIHTKGDHSDRLCTNTHNQLWWGGKRVLDTLKQSRVPNSSNVNTSHGTLTYGSKHDLGCVKCGKIFDDLKASKNLVTSNMQQVMYYYYMHVLSMLSHEYKNMGVY